MQVSNNERKKGQRKERDEEKKQRNERKIELIEMCYRKKQRNNEAEERKGKNAQPLIFTVITFVD